MDLTDLIQPKSDQWNADDFVSGPRTFTIAGVKVDPSADQKISIELVGSDKVFRPCKSMARVMVQAWGPDASTYGGRSMTLYRDPTVKWGGMEVGGIRISHLSHIDKPLSLMLTMTKQSRAPFKVGVLQAIADTPPPPAAPDNAADLARAAASNGKAAFTDWWNSDEGKLCRDAVKPMMAELQTAVAAADADAQEGDECPI